MSQWSTPERKNLAGCKCSGGWRGGTSRRAGLAGCNFPRLRFCSPQTSYNAPYTAKRCEQAPESTTHRLAPVPAIIVRSAPGVCCGVPLSVASRVFDSELGRSSLILSLFCAKTHASVPLPAGIAICDELQLGSISAHSHKQHVMRRRTMALLLRLAALSLLLACATGQGARTRLLTDGLKADSELGGRGFCA